MFMTDGNKVIGFKVLKYKNIIFDEWTKDEHGTWAEICGHCLKKYEGRMDLELDFTGGVGACSVRDCNTVGMDDDIAMTYIDFDINGVEIIEQTLEELIEKLKDCGMTLKGIEEELTYRDNAAEGMKWNDTLYEYTTEELEVLEIRWNDFE